MIKFAYTNIKYKSKINGLLSNPLNLMCVLSMLLCNISAKVLVSFINADKRIKDIQIGDHEIKVAHFAENNTIFLRDTNCFNR